MAAQEENSGSGGHHGKSEMYTRCVIVKSLEGCINEGVNIFRRRVMKRAL